jgi:hypothetical protein
MDILTARRVSAEYRFEGFAPNGQQRLDGVLRRAAGGPLEIALMQAGLDGPGLICLKLVDTRIRVRLQDTDEALAGAWSLALVDSIRHAATQSESANLVRYRSRAQALTDLVVRVLQGDFERAWAWRQIGLWPDGIAPVPSNTAVAVAAALASEPRLLPAIIAEAQRLGVLDSLVETVPDHLVWLRWAELAWSAVTGGELPPHVEEQPGTTEPGQSNTALLPLLNSSLFGALRRIALIQSRSVAAPSAALLRAWAALILLACEPARAGASASSLLPLLVRSLDPAPTASIVSSPGAQPATGPFAAPANEPSPASEADSLAAPETRKPAVSRYGGLLYLLNLLDQMGLVAEFLHPHWPRSVAWTLHRLALLLTPGEEDDPAVLAFAGLGPDARLPSEAQAPPSDLEFAQLALWKQAIAEDLEHRLDRLRLRGEPLLRFVCDRPSVILADPGWLEVRLRLDDVSVDIRRARLDLNPGYLPWLGITVVFVYE